MFDFHEKRKIKSFLYSKVVVFVLLLIAALLSISVYHRFTTAEEMEGKLDSRRAALLELENRAEMLRTKVEYLENERGVEEELRNRFDVAKEGEQVVILINKPNEENIAESNDVVTTIEEKSQIKKFFNLFKFW